ncbi:hypothetical protein E2C01_072378 [Portunus trituberculatus]|uniref:Uncharacterized protein n=1 Tax=Portunus trituberculatus TaxID=210409 RepID=A0A5B7I7L8_PORTR|nr:hypothetical protein [Portunus trituberculatus]
MTRVSRPSLLWAGQTQLVVRRVNRPVALGTQQLQWQWSGAERGAPIVALFDNAATRRAIVAAASRASLYCRRSALLYKYGDNTGGGGGGGSGSGGSGEEVDGTDDNTQ